jgi:hypothetical protein
MARELSRSSAMAQSYLWQVEEPQEPRIGSVSVMTLYLLYV